MRSIITKLDPSHAIVNRNTGEPLEAFRIFMLQTHLNGLLIGTGSPEGIVEAQQGRMYMDETGLAGAVLFIKQTADDGSGDRTKGWIAI